MSGDLRLLLVLGLGRVLLHALTNGQYGFHRDELATLDDARFLDWGYVAYPPVAPFVARLALELFGPSLVGLRFFAALAQGAIAVLTGLMARELGGGRGAQVFAALAASVAPAGLISGGLFQYVTFDALWWVLAAYCAIRLLGSGDRRWWLAIGAVVGLGLLTKYTILVFSAGIAGGMLLTRARHDLASRWPWAGAALALLIFLPNLLWQAQHDFVSLDFLRAIHERDVQAGRTQGFLPEQLFVVAAPLTIPVWLGGIWFYLAAPAGRPYRMVGWMYLIPLLLLLVAGGRSYYLAPAYPMLLAAGAVLGERRLASSRPGLARMARAVGWGALALSGAVGCLLFLPVAPVNSGLWAVTSRLQDNFVEEIGWPELVDTVATIYAGLPPGERESAAILAGNYGEAGAIDLYGPARGLPRAISGVNSYWQRGYGDPPPRLLIVLGFRRDDALRFFERCDLAGTATNRYGVPNEETRAHPDILVCRDPRRPWPDLWQELRRFG